MGLLSVSVGANQSRMIINYRTAQPWRPWQLGSAPAVIISQIAWYRRPNSVVPLRAWVIKFGADAFAGKTRLWCNFATVVFSTERRPETGPVFPRDKSREEIVERAASLYVESAQSIHVGQLKKFPNNVCFPNGQRRICAVESEFVSVSLVTIL